jgi:hypothetical protein
MFSDWVTGTAVHFDGMTGRALAVILKLNFVRSQKKLYSNELSRILTGHPVCVAFIQYFS